MKARLCTLFLFIAVGSHAQLRCKIEAGGSYLAGFGVNLEYATMPFENSNIHLIPKIGIGHSFADPALILQTGMAIGIPVKSHLLKLSSDFGLTLNSPFFEDGSFSYDLYNSNYDSGDALFWHVCPEFEWRFKKTYLAIGLGPVFEFSNPFRGNKSSELRLGVWPKLSFGFDL